MLEYAITDAHYLPFLAATLRADLIAKPHISELLLLDRHLSPLACLPIDKFVLPVLLTFLRLMARSFACPAYTPLANSKEISYKL